MNREELQEFNSYLKGYIDNPEVRKMADFIAHGKVSVLHHSLNVAMLAYLLNSRLKLKADLEPLLIGALLHDFYLYDWHEARLNSNFFKMHGFTHPKVACDNAIRHFAVDKKTQEVISCHMWPLTLRSLPRHKEAILVCIADKLCAIKETFVR